MGNVNIFCIKELFLERIFSKGGFFMKKIIPVVLLVISIIMFLSYNIFFRTDGIGNSSYSVSRYGSRGEEVREIQTKLKRWGYYTGNVDGVYGTRTLEAVKLFQRKNGLTADRNSRCKNSFCNGNNK